VVRRVLALVLLGVVVVACAALAASESLRNDSRKTAYGVTIQFSDSVRITSWDTATFPTCSPSSGRAESFAFSGGELASSGQFRVSWTPSTAEITNTEWETTGANAAGSTSGTSAPLTYEEIMAQIAHYPGPDEPLYVPAEGEQIWLTDLEGHADIYDNDSIRINYAPGFDKSLISRIDVYRNGVKMRFAPALFDVLTNEQMKTFDGNPAENSPASNHTDHAIFGYAYRLQLYAKTAAPIAALTATIRSPVTYRPTYLYAHIDSNWVTCLVNTYFYMTDSDWLSVFREFKDAGFTGVQVETNWFIETSTSSRVFGSYTIDPQVHPYMRTETDEELRHVLSLVKTAGLDIELRVQLYVSESGNTGGACNRSAIRPSNPNQFFANLGDIAVHLATLAEEFGAKIFCPLVEMNSLVLLYPEQIRTLLTRIDQVFSGKLAVDVSVHHYLAGFNCYNSETDLEANVGTFWDWRDDRGRPALFEMNWWPLDQVPLETQKDQRFTVMVERMVQLWMPAIRLLRSKYPDVPLTFGEIGTYTSRDGAVLIGVPSTLLAKPGTRDDQEYRETTATHIVASAGMELDGMCVWGWAASWSMPGRYESGFTYPSLFVIAALIK
jgi:hypothetical protein